METCERLLAVLRITKKTRWENWSRSPKERTLCHVAQLQNRKIACNYFPKLSVMMWKGQTNDDALCLLEVFPSCSSRLQVLFASLFFFFFFPGEMWWLQINSVNRELITLQRHYEIILVPNARHSVLAIFFFLTSSILYWLINYSTNELTNIDLIE